MDLARVLRCRRRRFRTLISWRSSTNEAGDRRMRLLAFLTHSSGRTAEAIEWIRRTVALRPDSADLHGNLGVLLASQGRFDAVIRQAVALQPNNPILRNNLGNALLRIGHADDAIAEFRQALAVDPRSPEAHCVVIPV